MVGNEYIKKLENVIKQMLQPLKDIPFNLVIETMTGKKVISFDFTKKDNQEVLKLLKQSALNAGKEINKTGILRPRPNEVGNDIEPYVRNALNLLDLTLMKTNENNDFKSSSFVVKKLKYKESELWLTNSLANYDEWTIKNIQNRQKELADLAVKAWSIYI